MDAEGARHRPVALPPAYLISTARPAGPRDVGAYERQQGPWNCGSSDAIFCDGFES